MGRLAVVLPPRPLGDWGAALLPRPCGERAGVRGWRRWMCAIAPSPLWGEGWGEGRRRWMGSLLFDVWLVLHAPVGRDMRPAAHRLSFASPKESRQSSRSGVRSLRAAKLREHKSDPTGRVPSLRCGQPAMLAPGAVLRNSLCSLRSRRSDNRSKSVYEAWACCAAHARPSPCASRDGQRGGEHPHGPSLRLAPRTANTKAERSDGPNFFSTPLRLRLRRRACGVTRAQQDARASWSDSPRLFERSASARSEFCGAPRKCCGAGLPRSEAQGSQTWGRFLCLLSCACKKAGRPAGASPGQRMHAEPTVRQATANISNAQPLTPALSPEGRGSKNPSLG